MLENMREESLKRAYVLVNSLVGSEDNVLKKVTKIPEVKKAQRIHGLHGIHGIYGLIVLVEAETIQEIDDIVLSKIRSIDEVQFALKMICID